MYAKSMIEYARARIVASALSRHLGFAPVILALAVAALPFLLERQFLKSAAASSAPSLPLAPHSSNAPRSEPLYGLENPFRGLVQASVVTTPKRVALPLDAQQRAVAGYITRKYGVSTEVVQELVRTAFAAGQQFGVDPLLLVAMMAMESSFNPIAESVAGAKGLMQIIPKYHLEKFVDFGGEHTVLDPRVNILVGARIVREYLLTASGDLFTALQTYAGALADRDATYTHRVLNEKDLLDALAGFPKTDRGDRINRLVMQVDRMKPGTLVIPAVSLPSAPLPVAVTPATVPSAAPLTAPLAQPVLPVAPAPQARSIEEAAHTPPTQLRPQPAPLPPINVTLLQ